MKKKDKAVTLKQIEHEEQYVAFLRKRLDSENFKKAVTKEEYDAEKRKYDKAKFKLKMLKEVDSIQEK